MMTRKEKSLDSLPVKYPSVFSGRSDKNVPFYFECEDGWYDIIDVLCSAIQQENEITERKNLPEEEKEYFHAYVVQAKEKFGGLRFYVYGGNERIHGMITIAESMSYRTCEVCGKPGTLRKYAWLKTHCDEHVDHDRLKSE